MLSKQVEEIDQNDSLDPIAKSQMLQQAQQAQQQRMSLARQSSKKEQGTKEDSSRYQPQGSGLAVIPSTLAILLPPIPAVVVGICVLLFRWSGERKILSPGGVAKKFMTSAGSL